MAQHNELGKWGEQKAAEYLESLGYAIMERDWQYDHKDIDIVAVDYDTLVFVEVKTRSSNRIMDPEEAVDARKIHHLAAAANAYIRKSGIASPYRFDIVAITGTPDSGSAIKHIKDAFEPRQQARR